MRYLNCPMGQCFTSSTGASGSTPRSGRGGSEFESQVGDLMEVDRTDEDTVSKTAAAKPRCRFDSCGLRLMRHWSNGKTPAFQAGDESSSPSWRTGDWCSGSA
jgi:hypothetical protein